MIQGQILTLTGWAAELGNATTPITVEIFAVQDCVNGPIPCSPWSQNSEIPLSCAFPATLLEQTPIASVAVPGNYARPDVGCTFKDQSLLNSGWITTINTAQLNAGHYYTLYAFAVDSHMAYCIGSTEFYLSPGSPPSSLNILAPNPVYTGASYQTPASNYSYALHSPSVVLAWQTAASGSVSISGSGINGSLTEPPSGVLQVVAPVGSCSWTVTGDPSGPITKSIQINPGFQVPLALTATPGYIATASGKVNNWAYSAGAWIIPYGKTVTYAATGGSGTGGISWSATGGGNGTGPTFQAATYQMGGNVVITSQSGDASYSGTSICVGFVAVSSPSLTSVYSAASTTVPGQISLGFTITDGNTYSLTAPSTYTITGPGLNYSGSGTGQQNLTLSGLPIGTNTYTITVTDPLGVSTSTTTTFTLPKIAQTVYVSPANSVIVTGQSATFTAFGGHSGYNWGGSASGTGITQTISFNTPGSYTVTASDPGNSQYLASNTGSATITVLASAPGAGSTDTLLSTTTYAFAGQNSQSYTVPAGSNYLLVKAWGGGGGYYTFSSDPTALGGNGALVGVVFNATGGENYTVTVGQGGGSNVAGSGGWPGGGNGSAGGGGLTSVYGPRGRLWAGAGGGCGLIGGSISIGGDGGTPNGATNTSWPYNGGGATPT